VTEIRCVGSDDLTESEIASLRTLFAQAWPDPDDAFTDEDWQHTLGGTHLLVQDDDGEVLAHASVVERTLWASGVDLATGYVEGVATRVPHRRRGLATAVMHAAGDRIDERFQLGGLGTDVFALYEPLGWRRWRGPTAVRTPEGDMPTPDDDGFVMVRLTPSTPPLDLDGPLVCDRRHGDVW
jgi:aminoglycoside 2'-N-acetyltransferase I